MAVALGDIDTTSGLYNYAGDNVLNFGTGPFSLQAGETEEIVLAIFGSDNYEDMLYDAVSIHYGYNWPNVGTEMGQSGGNDVYAVALNNLSVINGNYNVQWDYSGSDPNAKLFLEYSSNRGKRWIPLGVEIPAVQESYSWNTTKYRDGVNYLLRAVAYNPQLNHQYYFDITDSKFTINNPGNAQPEIEVDLSFEGTTVTEPQLQINLLAEDADNSSLQLKSFYSYDGGENFIEWYSQAIAPGSRQITFDAVNIPNSSSYKLKFTLSDGVLDTAVVSSSFTINYSQSSYSTNHFTHEQGNATPEFIIHIVEQSQITGANYKLFFNIDENEKRMSVLNTSTGEFVLSDFPLMAGLSTPAIEGFKLTVVDKETNINLTKSTFNRSELNQFIEYIFPPLIGNPRVALPNDWIFVFNDFDTTASGNYLYPADTIKNHLNNDAVIPFKAYNISLNEEAELLAYTIPNSTFNGNWKIHHPLILRPNNPTGTTTSYQIQFSFPGNNLPQFGDTLFIITDKEITPEDIFRFAPDTNTVLSVKPVALVDDYKLEQNYPNPFNPTTTIKYQIQSEGFVTLKIYDILGREVKTLVSEHKAIGRYEVLFNASDLASGVYIYRIKVNDYSSVKKLMLVK